MNLFYKEPKKKKEEKPMKAILAITLLAAAGAIIYTQLSAPKPQDISELWSSWKNQHAKAYASATEDAMRKDVFEQNYNKIQAHNADPEASYTMALNKFADMTAEEFKEYMRCSQVPKVDGVQDSECPTAVNCPTLAKTNQTSWDWTKHGAVTAVKNQGQCGSCWTFGATGGLEGRYYLDNKVLLSFSEQYIVDCDHDNADGCSGGFSSYAMEWVAKKGIILEKLYPYHGRDERCKIPKNATLYKVNKGIECVTQKDADQMRASVVIQPTTLAVEADESAWQFYSNGIVKSGCGAELDHNVLLVGFDDTEGYWKVKNSWGADWGEAGYIRIAIGSENNGYGLCGVLRCGTRAV